MGFFLVRIVIGLGYRWYVLLVGIGFWFGEKLD